MASEGESKRFQPAYVDPDRCQALEWGGGWGRVQCKHPKKAVLDFCGRHAKNCSHGRVTGRIPQYQVDKFKREADKPEKASKQWFSRHLMWEYAK